MSWGIVDFTASAHLPKPANHWPTTFQLLRHNNKESSAASHSVIPVATGIPSPFRHPVAGKQEWSACGARVFRIYNTNTRVTLTRHSRHSGNPEPFPHPNTWDNAGVVHTGLVSLAERRGVLRIPTKSFEIKGSGFPLRRERRGWGCAPILTSPSRGKEDIQDAPAAVYNAIALRAAIGSFDYHLSSNPPVTPAATGIWSPF